MITGNIRDFQKYLCIHKDFPTAYEYMKKCLSGDTASINEKTVKGSVCEKETNDEYNNSKEIMLEAHRKYIDIHFIIDGAEDFGYAEISKLSPETNYDEEKDCIFLTGNADRLTLTKGDFVIAYPEDAHAPSLRCNLANTVKRTVIKILL